MTMLAMRRSMIGMLACAMIWPPRSWRPRSSRRRACRSMIGMLACAMILGAMSAAARSSRRRACRSSSGALPASSLQILPACYGCHLEPKSNTGRGAFVHRFGSFVLVVAVECKPFDDGFIAEPFAQPVDRLLGLGAAAVDEVGEIGSVGVAERREADADQAEHGAVGFAREQVAPGGENPPGELGRVTERLRPRADAEIGGFELQSHGRAGEPIGLEPGGDLLGEAPQPQLQRAEVGDVAVEGGFRRNALGLALGPDRPVVEAAGEARESGALEPVAPPQFALAGALQVPDGAQAVARQALLRHLADAEDQRHRL